MTKPIRIGAQLHPQHGSYDGLRAAVTKSEELGYDIVYNWDHFFALYGDPDGAHFECLTMLGAWAEQTSTIEIGPLVVCNSYRNPELLADMARTIDHVSNGRFVLGIGGGWFERDYDEYGYEFGTAGTRLKALTEALPRIDARIAKLNPPPVRDMPILVAGVGEKITLRAVANHADRWHASFPQNPEDLEPKIAALNKWCDEIGRDANEIEWGVGVLPYDIERLLEQAPTLVEMGFTEFTLGINGPDWDVTLGADWLAWRDEMNG